MKSNVSFPENLIIRKLLLGAFLLLTCCGAQANIQAPSIASPHEENVSFPSGVCQQKDSGGPEDSRIFDEDQHASFEKQGFLVVSNLLDEELDPLVRASDAFVGASKKSKAYFSSIEMGMIFQAGDLHNETITKAFRRVALDSVLPQAASELMGLTGESRVRVLRDVFMSKDVYQDSVCGWHVDDVGFWPESYLNEEHEGINVWIAMEDMPARFQGSMALAPGSHTADWRFDAYHSIGQNRSYHGGFTKKEMEERARAGQKLMTTCEMEQQAPELSLMIDGMTYIPNIKRGDVVFAIRTLFHKTLPVTAEGKKYYFDRGIEHLNRYSIRYVPGTARLPQGWTFEWGVMANGTNAGKTLDEAMEQDPLLWYPQVWPATGEDPSPRLDSIAMNTFEETKQKTRAEVFELISLFSQRP